MDRLPPTSGKAFNIFPNIFRQPTVLVQRRDGTVEELTPSELKRKIDPNDDDRNWWEKIKDFFSSLWNSDRNLL